MSRGIRLAGQSWMLRHPLVLTLIVAVAIVATLSAEIKFTSTWKSIDAGSVNFTGKKLAALVISKDESPGKSLSCGN
jgi:hypothetical protein